MASLAQHLTSLLNIVALLDQHPDGSIEHGQFGEAGQSGTRGRAMEDQCRARSLFGDRRHVVHQDQRYPLLRSLVNGHAPEGVAQVGG